MKCLLPRVCLALLCVGAVLNVRAQDDQYVKVFNTILQADTLKDAGQGRAALEKYLDAEVELKKIQAGFPAWNTKIVTFRLGYLSDRITPLKAQFPGVGLAAPVVPTGKSPVVSGLETQISRMNDEMVRLRTDKARLEAQLKEALAARRADVDPARLDAAEQKIKALQKEVDLSTISLGQQTQTLAALAKEKQALQTRIDTDKSSVPALKKDNDELRKQVTDLNKKADTLLKDNKKMETLLTDPEFSTGGGNEKTAALEKELKATRQASELNQAKVDVLVRDKAALEVKLQDTANSAAKIKQLEKERDDLQKKLADALKAGEKKN